jgi:hypothetical protein
MAVVTKEKQGEKQFNTRLRPELEAHVQKFADEQKCTHAAAVHELIEITYHLSRTHIPGALGFSTLKEKLLGLIWFLQKANR